MRFVGFTVFLRFIKMKKNILYSGSGRSFISSSPIHKMKGVISGIEEKGFSVKFIGGNDLYFRTKKTSAMGGNDLAKSPDSEAYVKNSISEIIDMTHDFLWFFYVLFNVIRYRPSMILERSSRLHVSSLIVAKICKIPIALEWKNDLIPYSSSLFIFMARYIEKLKFRLSDLVVVESKVLAQSLQKKHPSKKFYVAYNAIDSAEITPPETKAERDIDLLYAGGFTSYHDMPNLAAALNKLSDKLDKSQHKNIKVVIIGNGAEKESFLSILKLNSIKFQLEVINGLPRNELAKYYHRAKFGILPGCTDIIAPIKIFEYIGYGMVPIIPILECNSEVFPAKAVCFFEQSNSDELANVLFDCIGLVDYAEKKSEVVCFQQLMKETYTWSETWGKIPHKLGIE